MKNKISIVELAWTETLPIRHNVLWPDKPIEFCHVEGDETAWHFGVVHQEKLVCVASIYCDDSYCHGVSARLRKFATLPEYQGQGIGSKLLHHILSLLVSKGISYFWCDARLSATGFYQQFGLTSEGSTFYKSKTPYIKMGKALS